MKGIFTVLVMLGVVVVMLVISGFATKWTLFWDNNYWNLQQLIRSFGEILLGMLCYYASNTLSKVNVNTNGKIAVTVSMVACYVITLVIMNLPAVGVIPSIGLPIAMILLAVGIILNFSGHDLLADKCSAKIFSYLGAISLPIYLLHTVVIRLFINLSLSIPSWVIAILVFVISVALSVAIFESIKAVKKAIAKNKLKTANS